MCFKVLVRAQPTLLISITNPDRFSPHLGVGVGATRVRGLARTSCSCVPTPHILFALVGVGVSKDPFVFFQSDGAQVWGLLRSEPGFQEEALTSFLKSLHRGGWRGGVGGIGQTRFPVRADRPEVARFGLFSGNGVDRVGLGVHSDPALETL